MSSNSTFVVLVVGIVAGIATFAFSHALATWRRRRRGVATQAGEKSARPILLRILLVIASLFLVIRGLYSVVPHNVGEYQGLLVGEGLYSVRDMPGYAAEFPSDDSRVDAGDPVVLFYRNPSPREVQKAVREKALLTERLRVEQLRQPKIDSFILSQYESLSRRLELASDRERQLVRQRNLAQLSSKNDSLSLEDESLRLRRELSSARFQLEQRTADLKVAKQELDSVSSATARNLVSKIERARIAKQYDQVESQLKEQTERVRSLEKEQGALEKRKGSSGAEPNRILDTVDKWLDELHAETKSLLAEYASIQKKLDTERERAAKRQQSEIQQLQIQLDDTTALLDSFQAGYRAHAPIVARAPWQGIVGYRSTSPSNPTEEGQPIVALYQPDRIWVRLRTSARNAEQLTDRLTIRVSDLHAPTSPVEFEGAIIGRESLPDDRVELRIACDPPQRLIRRLLEGQTVTLNVEFDSQGLALAGVSDSASALATTIADVAASAWSWTWVQAQQPRPRLVVLSLACIIFLTIFALLVIGRRRKTRASAELASADRAVVARPPLRHAIPLRAAPQAKRSSREADENAVFIRDLTVKNGSTDSDGPQRLREVSGGA